MRCFAPCLGILVLAGASLPAAGDGIKLTLTYTPSTALDVCVAAIRSGGARVGADAVTLEFVPRVVDKPIRRKLPPVELHSIRDPLGYPGRIGDNVRIPFLFRDASHFSRFQQSGIVGELSEWHYAAYGGASHLFSFRAALTEPKHVSGQGVAGSKVAKTYERLGAKPAAGGYSEGVYANDDPAMGDAYGEKAAGELAKLKSDRDAVAGLELPLLDIPRLRLDESGGFLNLTFSMVDPIVVNAEELLKRTPIPRRQAVEAWAKAVSLQCSQGVLAAEEKTIASLRGKGTRVVPVNREGFVPAGWRQGLETTPIYENLEVIDRIAALGWPAKVGVPSRYVKDLDPPLREAWRKSLAEGRQRADERRKQTIDGIKREKVLVALKSNWREVRGDVVDALSRLPPPKPSGSLLAEIGTPPPTRTQDVGAGWAAAADLHALIDPVRKCPADEIAKDGCTRRVKAWLAVARARSTLWSSYIPGRGPANAVDRAIELVLPGTDGAPRQRMIAADLLSEIAEIQREVGDGRLRRTIDLAAAVDLSHPSIASGEATDSETAETSDQAFYQGKSALALKAWLVRAYRDLGDLDAAKETVRSARRLHLVQQASVQDDLSYPSGFPASMRIMSLVVGDYDQAWKDHLMMIAEGDQQGMVCDYGLRTCRERLDIRRVMFLALDATSRAAMEVDPENRYVGGKGWVGQFIGALFNGSLGGLEPEIADLTKEASALAPKVEGERQYLDVAIAFAKADADGRKAILCRVLKCLDEKTESDQPVLPELASRSPSSGPEGHPIAKAVVAREWEKALAGLERLAPNDAKYDDRERIHDEVFPNLPEISSFQKDRAFHAEYLAEAAAFAGEADVMRRVLRNDGDTPEGTFAGRRGEALMQILELCLRKVPR